MGHRSGHTPPAGYARSYERGPRVGVGPPGPPTAPNLARAYRVQKSVGLKAHLLNLSMPTNQPRRRSGQITLRRVVGWQDLILRKEPPKAAA
jgi:hypothetical protein